MGEFVVEAWTLLSIAVLFTMLRTCARIKQVTIKGLQPNDYLVWVAIMSSLNTSSNKTTCILGSSAKLPLAILYRGHKSVALGSHGSKWIS
ncbi:hypothetical protein F4779DRAFT_594095 [Xylariaceae sp. FL0662B]|nr:hypothetical protein F4779DRAFT_594095 [Xylariaceae sp. FL0662B]